MDQNQESAKTSRREFLRAAAVSAAAAAATTAAARSSAFAVAPGRVLGANDRIRIAHVGIGGYFDNGSLEYKGGGQGMTHVRLMKDAAKENNTEQVAVCDLYVRRARGAQKFLGLSESGCYTDYRRLMENKDIDAVWVTTSDNWHAPIAQAAMEAGKHVYIEKPMCRSIEEAFQIYDTAKKTGKIVQVGSQGCSDQKWHVAGKVCKSGRLGHVVMAQGSYCRNSRDGEWNYYAIDPDAGPNGTGDAFIDWEVFRKGLGPKEWDADRYFRWRKYWAYGNGIMGDLFPHRLHPLMIAMALPMEGTQGFPARVSSMGGLYVQKINPVTKKVDREVPDFTNIAVDFDEPNECSLMLLGSTINEQGWQDMIRGNKATVYFGGDGVEIRPERVYADEIEGGTEPVEGPGESIEVHEKNFLDCIRSSGVPNCSIDLAVRVQTMISLGEMAYRRGRTMHFDPKTRKYWG